MASQVVSVFDDGKLGRSDHSIIIAELKVTKMLRKKQRQDTELGKGRLQKYKRVSEAYKLGPAFQ